MGVTDELVIGRENADLTVDDAEVSRRHVAVRLKGGELEVEDLGSANGTFVNGSRIEDPVRVSGGAKIRIGQTEFEVRGVLPTKDPKQDLAQTQASPIADPEATRARPILDPEVTKVRSVPDPQVTKARAIPEPDVTKARSIPDLESTKARAIPDVGETKAHATPDPQLTQARRARPEAPAAPAPAPSKDVAPQLAPFSPPARRRSRGLASRRWVPTVASFGTAIAAAAGLIVYFAVHGVPG